MDQTFLPERIYKLNEETKGCRGVLVGSEKFKILAWSVTGFKKTLFRAWLTGEKSKYFDWKIFSLLVMFRSLGESDEERHFVSLFFRVRKLLRWKITLTMIGISAIVFISSRCLSPLTLHSTATCNLLLYVHPRSRHCKQFTFKLAYRTQFISTHSNITCSAWQ